MNLAPFQHELNGSGTDCSPDCPACFWVMQNDTGEEKFSLALALTAAKMVLMELDELLLAKRELIGPALLELVWIAHQLRQAESISIGRAAVALGKDKRTVSRNFRRLENVGLLKRQARAGRPHLYWLPSCQ